MQGGHIAQELHFAKGFDPVADAFDTDHYTTAIDLALYEEIVFLVHRGVGVTGTSTFTLEAADGSSPLVVTAIPFHYREITSGDTHAALKAATSAGFVNTAGSSSLIAIMINAKELASSGYQWVRLRAVESVNSPVLAGVSVILIGPRYAQDVTGSALT